MTSPVPLPGRDLRPLISPTRYNGPVGPVVPSRGSLGSGVSRSFIPSDLPKPDEGLSVGGIGSAIIDLLSRGVYASAGFSKQIVKQFQGDKDSENAFGALWNGLQGNTTNTYSDVISEIDPDAPEWVKFAGGLAGDILLDPANLVFGGVGALARAGVKTAQAGKIAAKAEKELANSTVTLTAAQKKALPQISLKTRSGTTIPLLSVNRTAGLESNSKIAKAMEPFRRRVTPGYGFESMFNVARNGNNIAESNVSGFRKDFLSPIAKELPESNINDGYSAWKRGVIPVDPDVRVAFDRLAPGIDRVSNANDPVLRRLASSHSGVDLLNREIGAKGVPFKFDGAKAMSLPRGVGTTATRSTMNPDLLWKQMKNWDVTDPLKHLDQMHQATAKIKVNVVHADDIVSQWGKTTPRPGYGKLKDLDGTELGPYLKLAMGGKNMYFPQEILDQLTRLNDFMSAPTTLKGAKSKAGQLIYKVVVPAMNIWKPYMTIARPGHHVRNLYSDIMINGMDGVFNPGVYAKAKNMLQAGGAIKKQGVAGLDELATGTAQSGAKKMSTVRLKGRNDDLTNDQMYKLGYQNGLFPSHQTTQDFLQEVGDEVGNFQKLALDNKYMKVAGQVSEMSNHYTRGAHFISLMERKSFTRQFKSTEEAAAAAAIRVKKWHPDPTGLTPFERKNLRIIFPFYSWQRQILPMVMNAAISKPGRVTGLNKAGYEFSKAMGMNPQSIGDPFPASGVYPSFVEDNLLGPLADVGGMQIGIASGSPQESILGDILNSPRGGIAGALSPAIKMPIEALSGVDVDTGRPILSRAEHTDQDLPVINYIAKASGYSPTSLIANLLSGDVSGNGKFLGMNETLDKKRKTYNPALTGINWLTGLGASDFQKSTYRNIALKEVKDENQ